MIADHLRLAERHVALGRQHIERQRQLLAKLKAGGHPTDRAVTLLRAFEEMQAAHMADRNRLRGLLEQDQR
jgi:hypothetical protein